MSERPEAPARLRYGVPACPDARDRVDQLLLDWARERPDLDFSPVGIITRLARVRSYIDAELRAVFARFGLTAADFTVIITLRRAGAPYTMAQARLMDALGLTSGTVSVRLDRLELNEIVVREPDPASARSCLVRLTDKGLQLFDEIAPVHLANEDRLLAALSPAERQDLSDLLRRLLAGFEPATTTNAAAALGLTLEPAHLARERRQAVGLSGAPGLLVTGVAAGSAAASAGIERGDLLTDVDGTSTTSAVALAAILDDRPSDATISATVLRGNQPVTIRLPMNPVPAEQRGRPGRLAQLATDVAAARQARTVFRFSRKDRDGAAAAGRLR